MQSSRRHFVKSIATLSGALPMRVFEAIPKIVEQEPNQVSPPVFYDDDGLIVHRGNDGGDTAQREGWYWLGLWVRQNVLGVANEPWMDARKLKKFEQVLDLLEPKHDGVFYRHPKLRPWNNPYDKEWGFSRDQMIPLVAAMGVWGFIEPLRRLWNALPQDPIGGTKHTFNGEWVTVFHKRVLYTGDVVDPAVINLFRRAWGEDPSRSNDNNGPAGEKDLLANAGLRCPPLLNDRDDTGNDLNLIVMLLVSLLRFPTGSSKSAVQWYSKNRLVSYGSYLKAFESRHGPLKSWNPSVRKWFDEGIASGWTTDCSRVLGAVRWYQRAQTGANPKLAELYVPIIRRYFE